MKKQTKSSLTRKLDIECSRIIRSYGQCAMCWSQDYSKLQCAHIFSRTYRNTRWDLQNLIPLCAGCHFKSHKNPILFSEFVREYLGNLKYLELKQKHNVIKRWTVVEMEELLKALKNI